MAEESKSCLCNATDFSQLPSPVFHIAKLIVGGNEPYNKYLEGPIPSQLL